MLEFLLFSIQIWAMLLVSDKVDITFTFPPSPLPLNINASLFFFSYKNGFQCLLPSDYIIHQWNLVISHSLAIPFYIQIFNKRKIIYLFVQAEDF